VKGSLSIRFPKQATPVYILTLVRNLVDIYSLPENVNGETIGNRFQQSAAITASTKQPRCQEVELKIFSRFYATAGNTVQITVQI